MLLVSVVFAGCTNTPENKIPIKDGQQLQSSDTEIFIPLSDLSTTATFYEYDVDGVTVRFFAVLDDARSVRLAADACDACYYAKKGYRQNGDDMLCINCGLKFSISGLGIENKAGGGCWPSFIPMTVQEENVVIKISDLKEKTYLFV